MEKQTVYDFLCDKKQSGELAMWFNTHLLPTQLTQWMEIYDLHVKCPEMSQHQLAKHFGVSQKTIWNVYQIMNEHING